MSMISSLGEDRPGVTDVVVLAVSGSLGNDTAIWNISQLLKEHDIHVYAFDIGEYGESGARELVSNPQDIYYRRLQNVDELFNQDVVLNIRNDVALSSGMAKADCLC